MRNKHYPLYPTEEFHTVRELLDLAAEKYKDKDAYIYKIRKNTYKKTFGEFAKEVHALASFFHKRGYSSQRIAILGENSYEWLLTWFAVVISGNTAVPSTKCSQKSSLNSFSPTRAFRLLFTQQFADFIPAFKDENELLKVLSMETTLAPAWKRAERLWLRK